MSGSDRHFGSLGAGELRPGATPRRWEPECGVKKLNDKIHKESKFADDHKNLPFSFRKPPKPIAKSSILVCDNCGAYVGGTVATVGIICRSCNQYSTVSEA